MTNFNNTEQKDNLANSSFPCEIMDGRQSVDVHSNEDAKKRALRRTIIFVAICLVSMDLLGGIPSLIGAFIGPTGYVLELCVVALICVAIYWYKTGRYWITDKISKGLVIVGCVAVISMVIIFLLRFGLFALIANKDMFIVKILSTIGTIALYGSPVIISLVVLTYSSWAMLSYHKESTSRLEKK